MSFESPLALAALVVIPAVVAAYVSSVRRRSRRAATLATQGLVTTSSSFLSPASRSLEESRFTRSSNCR